MADVYPIFHNSVGKNLTSNYRQYTRILSKHPALRKVINSVGPLGFDIPIWPSINDAVIYAVIGQMLSNSASASIISRLYQEFESSCAVLEWAQKSCYKKGPIRGVSQRKRKAFRAWHLYAKDNYGKWKKWTKMPLPEYREEICSIWGFGRWSADMIAIFHLGRMDVWPETDAGLQKACGVIFKNQTQSQVKGYIAGCETVAALYLWALINKKLI